MTYFLLHHLRSDWAIKSIRNNKETFHGEELTNEPNDEVQAEYETNAELKELRSGEELAGESSEKQTA